MAKYGSSRLTKCIGTYMREPRLRHSVSVDQRDMMHAIKEVNVRTVYSLIQ